MTLDARDGCEGSNRRPSARISRRAWLIAGGAASAGILAAAEARDLSVPLAPVFVAANQKYSAELAHTIDEGFRATGLSPASLKGMRVLLKPNMVEPARGRPQMTTHPAVVVAAAKYFRKHGATVTVGEAPGHVRDTQMALEESGIGVALAEEKIPFADLNYQQVRWFPNRGGRSPLKGFYFPQAIAESDLVVSLPKLKTHHWVGMTACLKNLYGTLPGIKYGWPKNILHHAGIPETVADIHASLPRCITIVDAIECMEGDGPILGTSKWMGLLILGCDLPAVDATCARIMGLEPGRLSYLPLAVRRGAQIAERKIPQRGEPWRAVANPFALLDAAHLHSLRSGVVWSTASL